MARKKRDEAEIEAVQKELPLNPPSAVLETIKQRQKAAKLVYRCGYYREPITGLKQKAALVHCTACGESYYLSYAVGGCGQSDSFGFIDPLDNETKCTGKTCVCPECGIGAQAVHISHIGGTYPIEKTIFLPFTISEGISSPSPGSYSKNATRRGESSIVCKNTKE